MRVKLKKRLIISLDWLGEKRYREDSKTRWPTQILHFSPLMERVGKNGPIEVSDHIGF